MDLELCFTLTVIVMRVILKMALNKATESKSIMMGQFTKGNGIKITITEMESLLMLTAIDMRVNGKMANVMGN